MLMLMAAVVVAACSNEQSDYPENSENSDYSEVKLTFSPYEMTSMTRAAVSIADVVTHLDVWISESGTEVAAVHQSSSDAGFGTVSVMLNNTKTYTLTAVAHKCTGNATLTNNVIAFPDEKVSHSMVYRTTFTPATSTSLSCLMTRIVGHFRFTTTDQVPADAYTMSFALGTSFTRWNIGTSAGANAISRTATFDNFSRNQDGTMTFNLYIIPTNLTDTDHMDITVTALKQNGDEIETRTFEDVPIKAGYKTTYHGAFFVTEGVTSTFTVDDWNEFDTVNF